MKAEESFMGNTEVAYTSTEKTNFVVKKGTIIFVDPPGVRECASFFRMHGTDSIRDYNPRYWAEPEDFDPTRFMRPYNKDAFIP